MQQTSRLFLHLTHFLSPQYPPKISTIHQLHTQISSPKNQMLYNYLIHTFKFQESKALTISNRFSSAKTLENPQSVLKYFKALGFTNTQIISSAKTCPQILFANLDKTIKPKISLFENELGPEYFSNIGKLISKNPNILQCSLTNRLKPVFDIIRTILKKHNGYNAENGFDNMFRVLSRCSCYLITDSPKKMLVNVSLLESCGIVNSQLANLLIRAPRIFCLSESELRSMVSRVLDLGLSCDSGMFMHGLQAISFISDEALLNKFELFKSFGFTEDECRQIFIKHPPVFSFSMDKLRVGLIFFLETVVMERTLLIKYSHCLQYSMEDRVVPRYRVLKLLESKRILKKEPQFMRVLSFSEKVFLEKYISRFPAHEEDLLYQYKRRLLDSVSD